MQIGYSEVILQSIDKFPFRAQKFQYAETLENIRLSAFGTMRK